jgi:hypothetical protein
MSSCGAWKPNMVGEIQRHADKGSLFAIGILKYEYYGIFGLNIKGAQ